MLGQAQVTLFSHQEEELSTSSGPKASRCSYDPTVPLFALSCRPQAMAAGHHAVGGQAGLPRSRGKRVWKQPWQSPRRCGPRASPAAGESVPGQPFLLSVSHTGTQTFPGMPGHGLGLGCWSETQSSCCQGPQSEARSTHTSPTGARMSQTWDTSHTGAWPLQVT